MSRTEIPPFTFRQLAYLVAAADAGTVTAAAARHGVSPSLVSGAITDLERTLDATLCVRRKGRGVTLTPTGTSFVAEARPLLLAAGELALSTRGDGGLSGPVSVGCYPTLAPVILPVLLYDFGARHPDVEITTADVTQDRLARALADREIDVAFVYDAFEPAGLGRTTLYRLPAHVLIAADHPLAERSSVALEELVDEDLILLDVPPSGDHTLSLFAERGLRPRIRHRTSSYEAVRALVARGRGYAVQIQRPATMATVAGAPLVSLPIDPAVTPARVDAVWSADAVPTERVRAIVEFARGVDWHAHQPTALGG